MHAVYVPSTPALGILRPCCADAALHQAPVGQPVKKDPDLLGLVLTLRQQLGDCDCLIWMTCTPEISFCTHLHSHIHGYRVHNQSFRVHNHSIWDCSASLKLWATLQQSVCLPVCLSTCLSRQTSRQTDRLPNCRSLFVSSVCGLEV